MAFLAAAAPYLIAGGTALSALGQLQGGKQAKRAADFEAGQLDVAAGRARAASQRQAMEEKRLGKLAESRALAVGAATGGGSDVTVANIISDLAGETAYRSAVALYTGESQAKNLELKGQLRRYEGEAAKKAGRLGAFSTVLTGAASIGSLYGSPYKKPDKRFIEEESGFGI